MFRVFGVTSMAELSRHADRLRARHEASLVPGGHVVDSKGLVQWMHVACTAEERAVITQRMRSRAYTPLAEVVQSAGEPAVLVELEPPELVLPKPAASKPVEPEPKPEPTKPRKSSKPKASSPVKPKTSQDLAASRSVECTLSLTPDELREAYKVLRSAGQHAAAMQLADVLARL